MAKRKVYEVADQILLKVAEGKATYNELQKSTGTNWDTIKMHAEHLQKYGLLEIELIAHDPANGSPSHRIKLTTSGYRVLSKIKK